MFRRLPSFAVVRDPWERCASAWRFAVAGGGKGAFAIPILVLVLDSDDATAPVPVPQADRLLPAGPPQPQVIAFQGALRLFLPISESRVTAVGYQAAVHQEPVATLREAALLHEDVVLPGDLRGVVPGPPERPRS